MAQCPLCHAPVTDDFGLTECDSCGAQLIVHMDGKVEYSGAKVSSPIESDSQIRADAESLKRQAEDAVPFEFGDPPAEFEFSEPEPPSLAPPPLPSVEPEEPFDLSPEFESEPELQATVVVPPPPPPPSPAVSAAAQASPDLSDVAGFGNSDLSGGREGTLRYNLRIAGIDTADLREALRQALTDRKFIWDTDQLVRSIKSGELHIKNVSPVKAYVLISRLRSLPIQVSWEQYAVQQS